MKILVTGATGFVGSNLLTSIDSNQFEAVCPVRRLPSGATSSPGHIQYLPLDAGLTSATDWRAALDGCEAVVHLAGRAHIVHEAARDPLAEFRKINVDATLNLARQAIDCGVRRFVLISSIKVNGEQTFERPFGPTDTPAPIDAYGISKCEAERGLFALAKDRMEVVVLRPPLVYGPGVKANFLQLIKTVQRGIPLPFGAVHNRRSLVYVDNLNHLILRCVTHPQAANRVWMASDNDDLGTAQMIRLLAEALGVRARLLPIPPACLRAGAALIGKRAQMDKLLGCLQVDVTPTLQILEWTPPFSVQEGLQRTVRACNT